MGVFIAILGSQAYAQNTISLGANILGPAISSQYQLSERAVIRVDLGFIVSDNSSLSLNPQLLFHKGNNSYAIDEVGMIMPYHGPGLLIGLNDGTNVYAAEFVWGFELDLYEFPIEVFIDAGPSYSFGSDLNALSLTSSFGVRYKF